MSGTLPLLVVHGAWAWPIAVIVIAAVVAVRVRRCGWMFAIACATLAAALATAALAGVGQIAMARARLGHATFGESGYGFTGPREPYALGNLDSLSLAAALPGTRDEALEELIGRLKGYYVRDEATLLRWQHAVWLVGGCGAELAMLRREERIIELERLAPACDDTAEATAALVFLGEYKAAATLDPAHLAIADQIGAAHWASVVASIVSVRKNLDPSVRAELSPRLNCIEQYFRIRTGELGAADRLHSIVGADPSCKVIDALALPGHPQIDALAAAYAVAPDDEARRTIEALAWSAGAPLFRGAEIDSGVVPHAIVELAPSERQFERVMILAPLASATRSDPQGTLAATWTHLWQAYYTYVRGDTDAAIRELTTMPPTDEGAGWPGLVSARDLGLSIAMRTGTPLSAAQAAFRTSPMLIDAQRRARGDDDDRAANLPLAGSTCEPDFMYATSEALVLRQALHGDGEPLAELIDRCGGLRSGFGIETLIAIAPRLRTGRDRLNAQLLTAAPDIGSIRTTYDVLGRAILRRDLARIAQNAPMVAAWQALIDRHLSAFADREAATALVLWNLM